jgi:hypothetical protein
MQSSGGEQEHRSVDANPDLMGHALLRVVGGGSDCLKTLFKSDMSAKLRRSTTE